MVYCNIYDYFEKTVENFPQKIAYYDDENSYSFKQLQNEVLKIATVLGKREICRRPIIVFMEKSSKVLCVFGGITCSRNFYVPIDVNMPLHRIEKILETLKSSVVITEKDNVYKAEQYFENCEILIYENLIQNTIDYALVSKIKEEIIDTDLLYILFTSGSTGVPKGVSISHKAVIDFILNIRSTFGVDENTKIANQGPFYFDLSVLDIFLPIFTGATLYIMPPKAFKFPVQLLTKLKEEKINTIYWVPSALVLVANLRALSAVDVSGILKLIMFCGEVMPNKQLNIWRKFLPSATFVNMYGPTETTCASTYYIVNRKFKDNENLPIGKPFKNTEVLLLDDNNNCVSNGKTGEICIKGSSLANGYYNSPQKTNESFVQNPMNMEYAELIYKTGDLAFYNKFGELEYVSRKDFQIKHMGHRIELGEVETAINNIDEITSCCCVYDDKNKKIVTYIVDEVDENVLINKLKLHLPEYMIPNKFIYINALPLNSNGKVDRLELKKITEENFK